MTKPNKLKESIYHINTIFKVDDREHYLTIVLNKRSGEGHISLTNEDTHGPLFRAGTLDEEFAKVVIDAEPVFKEIRKFFWLIEGRLERSVKPDRMDHMEKGAKIGRSRGGYRGRK